MGICVAMNEQGGGYLNPIRRCRKPSSFGERMKLNPINENQKFVLYLKNVTFASDYQLY